MKKILLTLLIMITFSSFGYCEENQPQNFSNITTKLPEVVTFSEDNKWGLKAKTDNQITVQPLYKKMIRLGDNTWIVQNTKNKFGLIDSCGNELVPIKYLHTDRIVNKFVKFGNDNDYGLYDSNGKQILPQEYSKIDILYGQMFLTCKNYRYGIASYDGETILENEFEDIYMPKPNVMRIKQNGEWIELSQVNAETLTLPEDAKHKLQTKEDLNFYNLAVNTGVMSGYSVLTFSDYFIKIFSSISPAHEETIDELMLSQGAETVTIFMKLTWLPKYPITYIKKYYQNIRNPHNGPLSNVRTELKKQIK